MNALRLLADARTDSRSLAVRGFGAALVLSTVAACASGGAVSDGAMPEAATPEAATPETAGASFVTFTAAQVAAGEEEFSITCSECHSTSEFHGQDFQFRWRRQTAWQLFQTASESMPESAPGSLPTDTYVSLVAYLLQLNGYEAGSAPLAADETMMRQLRLDEISGPPQS